MTNKEKKEIQEIQALLLHEIVHNHFSKQINKNKNKRKSLWTNLSTTTKEESDYFEKQNLMEIKKYLNRRGVRTKDLTDNYIIKLFFKMTEDLADRVEEKD